MVPRVVVWISAWVRPRRQVESRVESRVEVRVEVRVVSLLLSVRRWESRWLEVISVDRWVGWEVGGKRRVLAMSHGRLLRSRLWLRQRARRLIIKLRCWTGSGCRQLARPR